MIAETLLVRQSGDGFYLTGNGLVVLVGILLMLFLIILGVNRR